jgi:glutaredoxin 2
MIAILSLNPFTAAVFASEKNPIAVVGDNPKEIPADVKVMLNRLDEIKKIDKSSLKSLEKKALRKEVRDIKANLRASGNGVYLSIGAILLIVLLLIILL